MAETIGLVASVFGILGVLFALLRFLFKNNLQQKGNLKKINDLIETQFILWKERGYSSVGGTLIKNEELVSQIDHFRYKFKFSDNGMRAYMLRNAIQNGLVGNWGFWLLENKQNPIALLGIITALDGTTGERPRWRAGHILETMFDKNSTGLYTKLAEMYARENNIKCIFELIQSCGIKKHINDLIKDETIDLKIRENAISTINEFVFYASQISDFAKCQRKLFEDGLIDFSSFPWGVTDHSVTPDSIESE
jgi:hypothetical protein